MDFGVYTEFPVRPGMTQSEAFDESFCQVLVAEKLGIDSAWVAEHHFSPERSVSASPMILASAIAAWTTKIRIGMAVQVLPLANPLRIAEEAATVDHISKGRFDFGVGRSGLTRYYQGFNVLYSESRPRFIEALEVIMKAWSEDEFSYQGEFYSYENVLVVPKPYQQPYPPTWIAVTNKETFGLAGKLGHQIFISISPLNNAGASSPVPQIQDQLECFHRSRQEAGYSGPGEVSLRIPVYVSEDSGKAFSEAEATTMAAIRYGAEELSKITVTEDASTRLRNLGRLSYSDIIQHRVMYGTPEAVVSRIQEYQETLGIKGVVLDVNFGGQIPNDLVRNSVRLIAEKVMPEFK